MFKWPLLLAQRIGLVRFYYLGLTLAVLGPLLWPGFVLVLDMVFTPRAYLPPISQSSYLFYAAMWLLNMVLPMAVIQKLLLCSIVYGAGLGLHRLAGVLLVASGWPRTISLLIGGTFYAVNPFTYSRFMAGQFAVLLGYALLPWFLLMLYRFHSQPSRRQAVMVGALGALVAILSLHSLGLIGLAAGLALLLQIVRSRRNPSQLKPYLHNGAIMLAVGSLLSLNWLLPMLMRRGSMVQTIGYFNNHDQVAFATVGSNPVIQIINILHLQGFWPEVRGLYQLPQGVNPLWGLVSTVILLLVGYGGLVMWRRRRFELIYFVSLAGLASLVALGLLQIFSGVLPLLGGYREPHKFVGLVALVFAVLICFGVSQIISRYSKGRQLACGLALVALIAAFTPTMWFGFGGQLRPVAYPTGWYVVDQKLQADQTEFNSLFLPWHLYMSFGFTNDRIIANPAPRFFARPVLISDDFEFNNIGYNSNDQRLRQISEWLKRPADPQLANNLAKYNIKYVMVARDLDYRTYNSMVRQTVFRPVYRDQSIELYYNQAWRQ